MTTQKNTNDKVDALFAAASKNPATDVVIRYSAADGMTVLKMPETNNEGANHEL